MTDQRSFLYLHMKEIKYRMLSFAVSFILCSIVCFEYYLDLSFLFISPTVELLKGETIQLIYTSPSEAFATSVYWCLFLSAYICFNVFLLHIYSFFHTSLTLKEKQFMRKVITLCAFLWNFSILFSFKVLIPIAIAFFSAFETSSEFVNLAMMGKISEYQSFYIWVTNVTTFICELPFVIFILMYYNVIDILILIKFRKIFYITSFIVAAIITPPDVIYQIMLASCIIILYEMVIVYELYNKTTRSSSMHDLL